MSNNGLEEIIFNLILKKKSTSGGKLLLLALLLKIKEWLAQFGGH